MEHQCLHVAAGGLVPNGRSFTCKTCSFYCYSEAKWREVGTTVPASPHLSIVELSENSRRSECGEGEPSDWLSEIADASVGFLNLTRQLFSFVVSRNVSERIQEQSGKFKNKTKKASKANKDADICCFAKVTLVHHNKKFVSLVGQMNTLKWIKGN